jgi:predicted nucleotidyltransferase component of viral defense system
MLVLKGGTAINLTIFNLPRLSVDIDYDFAENMTKEETAAKRERIKAILGQYMVNEGYALKDKSKHTHALDSYVYSYVNAAGNSDNLKVEINYILRSHALPAHEVTARTGGAFPDFTVRTLSPVEIFASKITALTSRAAARDLYDLNNMVHYGLFDESQSTMLRKCTVFYLAVAGEAAAEGFDFKKLADIAYHKIKTDLLPMIRNAERFDFAEAKERVSGFLSDLMELTDKEKTFLQRFSKGHYEPERLFDDADILDRITNHPMAEWRTQRIKKERRER